MEKGTRMTVDISQKVPENNKGLNGAVILASSAIVLAIIAVGLAAAISYYDPFDTTYAPLGGIGYETPQVVLNPVVELGGEVRVLVEKCNVTNDPVAVTLNVVLSVSQITASAGLTVTTGASSTVNIAALDVASGQFGPLTTTRY